MAVTKSGLALPGLTSTGVGPIVQLRKPCTRFGYSVTLTATTSVKVKLQGTLNNGVTWVDISTATLQIKSSKSGARFATTCAAPYQQVRMICSSMTSGTGRKIVGWVEGA